MLTRQTGVVLCDKSDYSQRKKLLQTDLPLWWMNKPARVLETWGLLGNATNLSVSIVFNGLWFPWVHAGMCVCLCVCVCILKRMNTAKPLPVWNGGPIMIVSFSMQPCKTKLHEIDYPHTWTSFVTLFFSLSPVTASLLGPVHLPPTENKCLKDACI